MICATCVRRNAVDPVANENEPGKNCGADTRYMQPRDVRLRCGERFWYVYNYFADWACDIRLEAILPCDPTRVYPICNGGESGRGAPGR